jgi:hypothetical protein
VTHLPVRLRQRQNLAVPALCTLKTLADFDVIEVWREPVDRAARVAGIDRMLPLTYALGVAATQS